MHYNYFLSAAFALCASQVSAESIKATLKTDQGKNTTIDALSLIHI